MDAKAIADSLRGLPAVHALAAEVRARGVVAPEMSLIEAARRAIEAERESLLAGRLAGTRADLMARVESILAGESRPGLEPVVNATGVIVHTGLGRAPLSREAAAAVAEVAGRYAPVELDLESGQRGRRASIVEPLLCRLTGAEAATVVNNNAAATMLALSTLALGRNVIVSRGELVEIGGSFRLPDVIEAGGARLCEVGTTNRTRASDYERAAEALRSRGETAGAIMKVHTSNYRIRGFTGEASLAELVEIGKRHAIPVIHDIGSGLIEHDSITAMLEDEPAASASVAIGADLVLFSGDKLLGGPQAGIIVGRRTLVQRVERNPLMRAVRVGKLTLAALDATLRAHRGGGSLPVRVLAGTPVERLRERAEWIASRLRGDPRLTRVSVRDAESFLGGGSAPTDALPSAAIELRGKTVSEEELAQRLRAGSPRVIGRIEGGSVWLDLRAVLEDEDEPLVHAILAALG